MSDFVELHAHCHDLVCSGDRGQPRGARSVSCSCAGRDERAARRFETLAELGRRMKHLHSGFPLYFAFLVGHDGADRDGLCHYLCKWCGARWKAGCPVDAKVVHPPSADCPVPLLDTLTDHE